jgi:hypothetical protein
VVAAVGAAALGLAAPAQADPDADFLSFIRRHGLDTSTAELRDAYLQEASAICNLYAVTEDNDAVNQSMMRNGISTNEAAILTVGSATFQCPEWEHLLP